MESYNEEIIEKSGLNIQLSNNIYLIDLLRASYLQEIRHTFALSYLNSFIKDSAFHISSSLSSSSPSQVTLLPDWTLIIHLSDIFCISTQSDRLQVSRANLKTQLNTKPAIFIDLEQDSLFSYISISLCKLFLQTSDVQEVLSINNFESLVQSVQLDIINYIYRQCRFPYKAILSKLEEAKVLMLIGETKEVNEYKVFLKPSCELLVNSSQCSESLEYTQSEDTGKLETSFRLSNTITGRFPRLSGSSIAVMETPGKETKKSYTEYIECMESPRFSNIERNLKPVSSTPVLSPKQLTFTIQEVKNFLLKKSPEKEKLRKSRLLGVKPLSFEETNSFEGSSKESSQRTVFEEQRMSCKCQSCLIF